MLKAKITEKRIHPVSGYLTFMNVPKISLRWSAVCGGRRLSFLID